MKTSNFTKHKATVLCAASVLLTLGVSAAALRAQTTSGGSKGGPRPGGNKSASKERFVDIVSKQFSDMTTPQGELRTAWGGVVIKSEDTVLKTEQALYNKKTEIANSPGSLRLDDAQNTVLGSTGTAFYRTRDVVITGKVVLTIRPKPEDKNAPEGSARREFKQPATITCTKLTYNWKTRIATATGSLTVKYEDRTVTADQAVYYGADETVVLTGNVHYSRPNGDKGVASKAIAKLKEGAEAFYAETNTGTFAVGADEENDNAPTPAAPAIPKVGTSPVAPPTGAPSGPAPTVPTPPVPPANGGGETTPPASAPATPPAEPPTQKP